MPGTVPTPVPSHLSPCRPVRPCRQDRAGALAAMEAHLLPPSRCLSLALCFA
ncbi:uncharacterized protein B0I36DRAFT_333971 [Microdochium trichocladiopsis]|uniref:Uncharacterized protein n=1 Tax=Microdochium trichocladiopsis TaxID=1682393 RepID=A0A9P9BL11_9PEZI|nr:uncharacterized protein B0I36DRAFT_333971 [Microdochium trichocladiopsis]KAH7021192.1 hypothetical protein B0I36DRAFT_333971 [Microdochium trichocladiopsis]